MNELLKILKVDDIDKILTKETNIDERQFFNICSKLDKSNEFTDTTGDSSVNSDGLLLEYKSSEFKIVLKNNLEYNKFSILITKERN